MLVESREMVWILFFKILKICYIGELFSAGIGKRTTQPIPQRPSASAEPTTTPMNFQSQQGTDVSLHLSGTQGAAAAGPSQERVSAVVATPAQSTVPTPVHVPPMTGVQPPVLAMAGHPGGPHLFHFPAYYIPAANSSASGGHHHHQARTLTAMAIPTASSGVSHAGFFVPTAGPAQILHTVR